MHSLAIAALVAVAAPAPEAPPVSADAGAVTIADASWLAGRWIGEGLGGSVEEVWSPADGGQMVGHFALERGGKPAFYELMLLDRAAGGLRLRVKHFNPDFTAWEDRGDWHSFEPRAAGAGELRFDGLTLRRDGEKLIIDLTMRGRDGAVSNQRLTLVRQPL